MDGIHLKIIRDYILMFRSLISYLINQDMEDKNKDLYKTYPCDVLLDPY